MTLDHLVTFERSALSEAVHALAPEELRLLLSLALTACPRTRRVWTTPLRLAEELNALPTIGATNMSPPTVDAILTLLVTRGHLALYARSHGALRSYEIAALAARYQDEPPSNLPVEPGA